MSNKTAKPVFQFQQKSFSERSVGETNSTKFAKKAPHFQATEKRSTDKPIKAEAQIIQTRLNKAGNTEGKVNVRIKSTEFSDQTKVKKTGPLSPRAPEKIKKNRAEEMKVYGENTCNTLFEQRPDSIVRVWATVEMAKKCGELFSYLAANKKVYHVVDNAELALVSGTEHHNGICMLVKKVRPFSLTGYLDIPRHQDVLVLIDGVQNAHNLGGVIRTCAVFGVKGVVVERAFSESLHSSAAMRVAEGGMEYVRILETDYADNALQQLRQSGYQVVHISANKQGTPLAKVRFKTKVVFVLSESDTQHLSQQEDENIVLSLANPLKAKLNIAVATGILLSHWDGQLV